jgi:glutathione S-transferase
MDTPYRLITIPPSHFCEKARWALDRAGLPFEEEPHPPGLHFLPCRRAGGGRTTPILVTDLGVFPDSTDILHFVDSRSDGVPPLFPDDPVQRAGVVQLEDLFDEKLGPHTRRLAYFHLLGDRELVRKTVLDGTGNGARLVFKMMQPGIVAMMRKGMRIDAEGAERSLTSIREVFGQVNDRLASGREFLVGGRFTAADLTFAALAAPVLLPRDYGGPLPSLDELSDEVLALIDEMRSTPAGDFALRMYRDYRRLSES